MWLTSTMTFRGWVLRLFRKHGKQRLLCISELESRLIQPVQNRPCFSGFGSASPRHLFVNLDIVQNCQFRSWMGAHYERQGIAGFLAEGAVLGNPSGPISSLIIRDDSDVFLLNRGEDV